MSSADQANLMWAGVIVAMMVVHIIWKSQRLNRISLCEISYWMSSLFFGVGPMVAWANSEYGLPTFPVGVIHKTYISVILFLLTLLGMHAAFRVRTSPLGAVGDSSVRPKSRLSMIQAYASQVPSSHIIIVYGLFVGVHLTLLLGYNIGTYGSGKLEVIQSVPYHILVLSSLSTTVLRTAIEFWGFASLWRGSHRYLACLILATSALFILLQTSRGQLITFCVIGSVTYLATRDRLHVKTLALGVLSFVLVFFVVLPELWMFRTAWTATSGLSTMERLPYAWEMYRSGLDRETAMRRQQDNLSRRPYIIGFNLAIFNAQEYESPMWGRVVGSSVLSVVPSAAYSLVGQQKRFFSSEAYAMSVYTGSMGDTSSNWPGTLSADFGIFGGVVAGLILGGLLVAAECVSLRLARMRPIYAFLILGAFVALAIGVEVLVENGWVSVRDSAIAVTVVTPFLWFLGAGSTPSRAIEGVQSDYR